MLSRKNKSAASDCALPWPEFMFDPYQEHKKDARRPCRVVHLGKESKKDAFAPKKWMGKFAASLNHFSKKPNSNEEDNTKKKKKRKGKEKKVGEENTVV